MEQIEKKGEKYIIDNLDINQLFFADNSIFAAYKRQ